MPTPAKAPVPPRAAMNGGEWAMLVALSIVWGGSFYFNAIAVSALPVFTVVVARVGLAALILAAVLRLTGRPFPRAPRILGAFVVMALLNNVIPFSLIVAGQREIGAGVAAILNASTPLFTVLFAHVLTADEKLTANRLAGVVLGLGGVGVMVGLDAVSAMGGHVVAQLLCVGAAISYAFAGIFGRRFARMGVPPITTAAGQLAASTLVLMPVMLAVDRPWTLAMPGWDVIAALVAVASLSSALAYVLYFRILSTAGATNLVLVTFLVPVSAILLGILFLGEILRPQHLAGIALIGLGLAAIDGRPWRALGRISRRPRSESPARGSPSR
ncbi:DMT family transporter [Acuticoccus kandeliae]|uniref:DMT family transporter n=1 Tax=Acuticoccus kandeliae TaxID=2073160 RepID=UPI001FE7CE7C|nr:DMT family transporter [Acuticoccus kandeliae]